LLVTVNNRLKFEIVHDLSCHPLVMWTVVVSVTFAVRECAF